MIVGREVLILISTVNSGKSARRTLECVQYYGGKVQGIAAIFSMLEQVDGIPVYSLFSPDDIAGYISSSPKECPMCRAGQKIDALANSFGCPCCDPLLAIVHTPGCTNFYTYLFIFLCIIFILVKVNGIFFVVSG